MFFKKMMKSFN